ncbi:myosin-binding protein 7-like isoform X2 [Carex rostrata]
MDSSSSGEPPPPLTLCPCSCTFCCHSSSDTWHRSVKRKAESTSSDSITSSGVVRVETETEIAALRETVAKQLEAIQELSTELDEERNAAASAANEAMAMILKLQREKADAQMEARQFKRFAEERMAHDNDELLCLEDLLLKREEMLQTLSAKLYAYRRKFEKLGLTDLDLEGEPPELDLTNYPPLKCAELVPEQFGNEEVLEIYEFGENPAEDLNEIENRIFNLEKEEEEEREGDLEREAEVQRGEEEQVKTDNDDDDGGGGGGGGAPDDMSDRVYTIDTVHGPSTPMVKVSEDNDVDIKKLYMRLEVLEADRESMRQALVAMRTEKAQLVLLQEIAQQLSKEVVHERKLVKKKSFIETFSIMALFKWLLSHVWKPKLSRVREQVTSHGLKVCHLK